LTADDSTLPGPPPSTDDDDDDDDDAAADDDDDSAAGAVRPAVSECSVLPLSGPAHPVGRSRCSLLAGLDTCVSESSSPSRCWTMPRATHLRTSILGYYSL